MPSLSELAKDDTDKGTKGSKKKKTENVRIQQEDKSVKSEGKISPKEPTDKSEDVASAAKDSASDYETNSLVVKCDKCGKDMPSANYELHKLRCDKIELPITGAAPSKSAKSKKKRSKGSKDATKPAAEDVEDFDELIAAAVKDNTRCHTSKCKNNAATLGQNCPFCAKRFCLTHYIAEAHGCGDKAKEQARAQLSRDGVLYRGSGVPDKKPSAAKRAHLERKLESRLSDMAGKRKPKQKEK